MKDEIKGKIEESPWTKLREHWKRKPFLEENDHISLKPA